jgi:DNA polymerase-3 subunit alpha
VDEKGNIQGRLGMFFNQAIEIEGTCRSQGKHAAGIVISTEPLMDICPMVYDPKSNELVAGYEMDDLEGAGLVKFDILAVSLLNKIHGVFDLLEFGELVG